MNFDEWYQRNQKELTDNFYASKLSWYSSRGYISLSELKQMMFSALQHRPSTELTDNERRIFDLLATDPDINNH